MERGRQSWSLPCRCSAFASVGTQAAFRSGCAARAPVQCPVAWSACVVTRCLRQLELTFVDSGEPWSEARERGRFLVSSYASDVPVSPGLRWGVDFTATSPGSGGHGGRRLQHGSFPARREAARGPGPGRGNSPLPKHLRGGGGRGRRGDSRRAPYTLYLFTFVIQKLLFLTIEK